MMDWLIENKEWVFSGIGVFLISLLYYLLKKKRKTQELAQKSADHSSQYQAGRDINISKK